MRLGRKFIIFTERGVTTRHAESQGRIPVLVRRHNRPRGKSARALISLAKARSIQD